MREELQHLYSLPVARAVELIEWYEQYRPSAGQRISVIVGPRRLSRELGLAYEQGQREFPYKGRTLVAIGHDQ